MERESSPDNATLLPARPARPLAPWIGGKRHLAERIVELIARLPHTHYCEAFVGQGGVFLRRPYRAPKGEAINDINGDVVTLFRVLQRHYVAFLEMLKWQLSSRAEFDRLMAVPPATLTDLERAARFLYLQRTAFGGKVAGRNFGVPTGPARFDVTKLVPLLEAAHDRLASVTIECLPWQEFVERYDQAGALFYLDPPYWGSEDDYGAGLWKRSDFTRLADRLRRLEGQFILSINDVPEIRRIFDGFWLQEVRTTYTIAGAGAESAAELLILRRAPPERTPTLF